MNDNALTNLDDLKKLCNDYFEAYNKKNLDETSIAIDGILTALKKISVTNEDEDSDIQMIKWIDSLPEEENELKFFLMDFMESAKDNKSSIVEIKKEILDILGLVVEKIKNEEDTEMFYKDVSSRLDEIMSELVSDGVLHIADEVANEIQDIYVDDVESIDFLLSLLNDITVQNITERYVVETIDKETGVKKVIHSTTFFVPVLMHSDKNILELPGVEDIQNVLKREVSKRYVAKENEVHMNSFVLEKMHFEKLSYENINDLVINAIVAASGFNDVKIEQFRNRKLTVRGRYKEMYLGVTLILKGVDSQFEEFEKRAKLFKKLLNDEEFMGDFSRKIKNPFSTFRFLPPVQWEEQEKTINCVNGLSNVFDILSEAKNDSEILYCEGVEKDWYYIFALEAGNRSLKQSVGFYLPLMKSSFYEMLNEFSNNYGAAVYKYKYNIKKERFNNILNSEYYDFTKMIKTSELIGNEWKSWINIGYAPSTNSLQ